MAKCYINKDKTLQYECSYELFGDHIEVNINYDISQEIEGKSLLSIDNTTRFKNRDLIIIDSLEKRSIYVYNAFYSGFKTTWNSAENIFTTSFISTECLISDDVDSFLKDIEFKIKSIRVYSKSINDLYGNPSVIEEENTDKISISLNNKRVKEEFKLNIHNISKIIVSDDWHYNHNYKERKLQVDINAYVELFLKNRINFDYVYDYIRELHIYLQLLYPDKQQDLKIHVCIDNSYFEYRFYSNNNDVNLKPINKSVDVGIGDFLVNCYINIPFRSKRIDLKNIPYIIFKSATNLEDKFLFLYRFIECYYKRRNIKGISKSFIEYGINNNYSGVIKMSKKDVFEASCQITSLRNHYVHTGYYIRDNKLKISFYKDNPYGFKNYYVYNIDSNWVFNRMLIMYNVIINIVFKEMLGYTKFHFQKKL